MASDQLKEAVSERKISVIAREIVSWERLAPSLTIFSAEQEELREDHNTCYRRKIGMLRKWRMKYGDDATYERLIEAAKDSKDYGLAHKIEEIIGISQ